MMDTLDEAAGDLYAHAVSTIGQDVDTMFSVSCILEGISLSKNMAREGFKSALSLARLHMRMATSMAVAMRM